jgi:dihydropteroate synthase
MKPFSIRCHKRPVSLETPLVMGILNVTPDSFYPASRVAEIEKALYVAEKMIRDGADILDIGGYSSRPGAIDISEEEEIKRIVPVVENLSLHFPDIPLSVDTFRSRVAREALDAGACMVNDISGGQADDKMFETVAQRQVPYVLMHMRGTPQTMMQLTGYDPDPVTVINRYFAVKIKALHDLHLNDIILDPGFGFAKTMEQNYYILKRLEAFAIHKKPILVGMSRKSMLFKLLGKSPGEMLNATTVVNTVALLKGASILRVHDVKEAVEAVKIIKQLEQS